MPPPFLDFLSLRTFSSVWFWLVVAGVWSAASHRPMGVPYDMVWSARRYGGEAAADLDVVARAFARRLTAGMASGGTFAVALASAALTALALLAVHYRLEFAQGLLSVVLPLAVVGWLSARAARAIDAGGEPARHLHRLRIATQAIAVVSLFVTAFWGVYVSLVASVL